LLYAILLISMFDIDTRRRQWIRGAEFLGANRK